MNTLLFQNLSMKYFPVLIFFLLGSVSSVGQIVINEYSASNLSNYTDNYGENEDWIELYNTSSSTVDLTGWYLTDKSNNLISSIFKFSNFIM